MRGWLRTFAGHYPRAADNPWCEEDFEIYGRGLEDLTLHDLNAKCAAAMRLSGSWAPTIGNILEAPIPARDPATLVSRREDCPKCGGTGWVYLDGATATLSRQGGVKPCECRNVPVFPTAALGKDIVAPLTELPALPARNTPGSP